MLNFDVRTQIYQVFLVYVIGYIYRFALNDNKFNMAQDLNRIKVVLVEQKKTGKWLAEQLGVSACTVS